MTKKLSLARAGGALALSLGIMSNSFGGTVVADWAEEMTLSPAAAGWGSYTATPVGGAVPETRVDGLLAFTPTGSSWLHTRGTSGGAIAPNEVTHGVGPLGTAGGSTNGVTQYTVDVRFKVNNYRYDLLVDGDGNSATDSNGDGDGAYDPHVWDGVVSEGVNNPAGNFDYGSLLEVTPIARNSAHGETKLGFHGRGFNLDGNQNIVSSIRGNFNERYGSSWMNGTGWGNNVFRLGPEPSFNGPQIQGLDLNPGGEVQNGNWHIYRVQFTANNEGKGAIPFDIWQGRMRFLVGLNDGATWKELGDIDVSTRPISSRDRSLAIRMSNDIMGQGDVELDYLRVSYAAVPESVLIGPAGAGTGNIVLSGGDVTRLEIGGDPINQFSFKPLNGTDFDVMRTQKGNGHGVGTALVNSVTLAGTVNFIGSTREGGPPSSPDTDASAQNAGFGDGNVGEERRYILPDIGQGPSRLNPDYDENDPINFPEFIVQNPASHRAKKITRKGVVKAATVSGSFSAVQYGGVAASVLAEKGLFVKTVGFTNRSDPDQNTTKISAHSGVDFVLLNAKIGDADGDEVVSATDVFTAVNNLGAAVVGEDWNRGNFDGDNLVSATDVFAAVNGLGAYSPTAVAADVSSIPEPTSGLLMVLAMGACAGLRRSRQGR